MLVIAAMGAQPLPHQASGSARAREDEGRGFSRGGGGGGGGGGNGSGDYDSVLFAAKRIPLQKFPANTALRNLGSVHYLEVILKGWMYH